jgi:hypothetical protein
MKRLVVNLLVSAVVCLGAASQTQAGYIFKNLIYDETYTPLAGRTITTTQSPDISFIAAETGRLSEVKAAIWQVNGNNPIITLTLTDSFNNILEAWTGAPPLIHSPTEVWDLMSVKNPLLQAGQTYQLTATTAIPNAAAWELDSNSLDQGWSQFRPTVGVDVLSIPEPGTLALAGLGMLMLIGSAARRRHRTSE